MFKTCINSILKNDFYSTFQLLEEIFVEDCFHISMEIGNEGRKKTDKCTNSSDSTQKSDIQCQKNEKRLEDGRRKERKGEKNNKKVENR